MAARWAALRLVVPLLLSLKPISGVGYEDGQEVVVSMNKVWPFANPTETYRYYDFPFCEPNVIMPHFMTLGQVLRGDRLVNSIYKINMNRNVARTVVCNQKVTEKDIEIWKAA